MNLPVRIHIVVRTKGHPGPTETFLEENYETVEELLEAATEHIEERVEELKGEN